MKLFACCSPAKDPPKTDQLLADPAPGPSTSSGNEASQQGASVEPVIETRPLIEPNGDEEVLTLRFSSE